MSFFKNHFLAAWNYIKNHKVFVLMAEFVRNKDVFVFTIFLLISTSFWFFNALRDKYVTDFVFSLRLVNVPSDQILLNSNTQKVNVQVRSTGYSLLRQYISNSFVPINYDVSKLHRSAKTDKAYLLSREQFNVIKGQLLVGIDLLKISPDTIFISLEPKEEKLIPIKLLGETTFQKQYALSGEISFLPESVYVSGQKSVIDTLSSVYTAIQNFSDLGDTLSKVVDLKQQKGLTYSTNKVELTIPVEPFSERTFSIPVQVVGMHDSLRLKVFPPDVSVTFRAGLSRFEKILESDFSAIVDASQLSNNPKPDRLKVRIESVPNNIQSYDFSPLYVEYLLERRR